MNFSIISYSNLVSDKFNVIFVLNMWARGSSFLSIILIEWKVNELKELSSPMRLCLVEIEHSC